jgi:hypothetical protein
MATFYIGVGLGENLSQVTAASSTTSKAVEVVVNDAVFTRPDQLFDALQLVKEFVEQKAYPPA